MKYFILLLYTTIEMGSTLFAGNVSHVGDLEYYGGIFRLALREERVPKLDKGMIDFYQLESYFRNMTSKEALEIHKRYKKMRLRLYSDIAKILYQPISAIY